MKDSFSLRHLLFQLALSAGFLHGVPASAVDWTITNLGTLGGPTSGVSGINNRGQVVGGADIDNVYSHAFLYDGTSMHDLYTLVGGMYSWANSINVRGQVVGVSQTNTQDNHAFLYDGTSMRDLLTLGGRYSQATSINASGQVVGSSMLGDGYTWHAFLYDGSNMRELGLNSPQSAAFSINTGGQIVGSYWDASWTFLHAYLLDSQTLRVLDMLGGGKGNYALGINDSGQVVGASEISGDSVPVHPFLFDGTTMHDLQTLGGSFGEATGINARGQVVGWSKISGDAADHAFLYEGGVKRDINTFPEVVADGWQGSTRFGPFINDSGQIAGTEFRGGLDRAFLLHPQTTSRYMTTVDTIALFNLGCAQTNQSGLLILDFGQPWVRNGVYGTIFPGTTNRFASIAGIENAVKFFFNGYYICGGRGSMTVAVGTNNFGSRTNFVTGQEWGRMVTRLNNYVVNNRDRLAVVGASDIEMNYNPPARSRAWVDGYASTSPVMYYNYGDAAGCPPVGTCNNGWTEEDIWYVSWGNAARPFPVPQIYLTNGAQARQWQALAAYGRTTHGTEVFIPAALTQWQACRDPNRTCRPSERNTPVQAWYQMMNVLHGVVGDPIRVQNILYSSDITWQN